MKKNLDKGNDGSFNLKFFVKYLST